jgi:Tfp pilus assembly protein PilF
VLLVTATLGVFWQASGFDFIHYDDDKYVTDNAHVLTGLTIANVRWAFSTGYYLNWHPVTWLSHMLDCQIFGLNAGPHHVVSILFHVANTLLLFEILKRMSGALWCSALVAALFALHPLHVQSVVWISERKDLLSTFFEFLAILGYCAYVARPTVRRYLLVLFPFALGLMAKSMIVTLPVLLLLLDYWPLGRAFPNPEMPRTVRARVPGLILEKLPLFLLSAGAGVVATFLMSHGSVPLSIRACNALSSYVGYLRFTFWPAGLAIFYPYSETILHLGRIIGETSLLLGITAGAIVLRRGRPYLMIGWLWYLIALLPVIGLAHVAGEHAMADRYTYVPLIGVFVAVVWAGRDLVARLRVPPWAAATGAVVILAVLTVATSFQVSYWSDTCTLFRHAVAVSDNNYLAHMTLGNEFSKHGWHQDALAEYTKALRIVGDDALLNYNAANELVALGRPDEAVARYRDALNAAPDQIDALYNLGNVYASLRKFREAAQCFAKLIELDPEHFYGHLNLGNTLAMLERPEEAIQQYLEAIRLDPKQADAYKNIGNVMLQMNRLDEAVRNYEQAIQLRPDDTRTYCNLGFTLLKQGKQDEAIQCFSGVLSREPDNRVARDALAGIKEISRGNSPYETAP